MKAKIELMNKEVNLKHIAIIMDGNGRWANERLHKRVWGHIRGARVVVKIIEEARIRGIEALTLYSFSSENWGRPKAEVNLLFKLFKKFLLDQRANIISNNLRFKVMGEYSKLPTETKKIISEIENISKNNTGLKLTIAFGHGGQDDIVFAANEFIKNNPGQEITKEILEKNLMCPDLGDVDLLIRTGGDFRISNFMIWQMAYAELYFTHTKWPDFAANEFHEICDSVQKRERRFGTLQAQDSLKHIRKIASTNKESFLSLN